MALRESSFATITLPKPQTVAVFDNPATIAFAALAFVVLALIICDASTAFLRVPYDPREGWNAYHAHAAVVGAPIYPAGASLWFDNYPPLSFYVVGALGRIVGDDVVAGRLVSLFATLCTMFAIGALATQMGCTRFQSALAAIMFAASPWVLAKFAAIDDPQMLGHALGTIGLVVIAREPRSRRSVAIGALLMALAEFIKPIFLAQPLAVVVWLAIYEPMNAVAFVIWGMLFAVTGLSAADAALHTNLLGQILSARVYALSRAISHPGQWCLTGLLPLAATLSLFRFKHDRAAVFCAIYAVVAFVIALILSGGDGVGGNMTFDASIAAALGTAVFINRLPAKEFVDRALDQKVVLVCLLPLGAVLIVSAFGGWASAPSIRERVAWHSMALADTAYIETRPGPAACEMASLCYWAGKPRELDVWGFTEALKTGARSPAPLETLLRQHYFRTIQLDPRTWMSYRASLYGTLLKYYRVDHTDAFGFFYVPRETLSVSLTQYDFGRPKTRSAM